jgi:hypothetical protein
MFSEIAAFDSADSWLRSTCSAGTRGCSSPLSAFAMACSARTPTPSLTPAMCSSSTKRWRTVSAGAPANFMVSISATTRMAAASATLSSLQLSSKYGAAAINGALDSSLP